MDVKMEPKMEASDKMLASRLNCDPNKTKLGGLRWPLSLLLLLLLLFVATGDALRLRRDSPAEATAAAATAATTNSEPTTPQTKPKPEPLNFTQIEEAFLGVLEEPEVAAKWRLMDRTMVEGVRAALKLIFPHVVAMSSDAKVSGNCSGAILKWILNLRNMRSWAVAMLDAIGKPGAGLLEGSLTMFGNYRQCLAVRAPDEDEIELVDEFREYFRGQYCVLQLRPQLPRKPSFYSLNSTYPSLLRNTKNYKYYERTAYDQLSELAMAFHFVHVRADLCVPSLCSRDDIQRVADFIARKLEMRAFVQRCETEPRDDERRLDDSQLAWAACLAGLVALVLASTMASVWLELSEKSNQKSKRHSLFTSMSLYKSLGHMKAVNLERINDSKPAFLYTLRLIIVLWFCLCELTRQLNFQFLRELLQLRSLIMMWPMQLLVNSSLQFDTLILLTAFTYSYSNINSNLKDLIKYNVAKYSRLMPSIMCLVAITILTPLLAPALMSPIWLDFVQQPAEVCKSTGTVNLLFLQNLLPYGQICLPQTWLFCVELQLCILSIPLLFWLNKQFDINQGRFRLTSLPSLALIGSALVGVMVNFLNIYHNQLPPAWFETFPDKHDKQLYFGHHLTQTWAHLAPFAVGLFTGHLCRCQSIATFSGRPYGRKCCDTLMWLTGLALMGLLIFSTHSWSLSGRAHLDEPLLSALYGSLGPLAWSLGCALLLFYLTVPNEKGHRPRLARLLAMDLWTVRFGRLAFLVYLISPWLTRLVLAAQQQPVFGSPIMLAHHFLGNLVLTFGLAMLLSALIELPCRRLIKKLALGSKRHCSNLGIINRQLERRAHNEGPSHDSFTKQQHQLAASAAIPLK